VTDGAAADVGLGDGGDGDGALGADGEAVALQGVLEGDGVDDGGQHAGVVGGGPVHTGGGGLGAAVDVAAADDDGDLDAHLLDGLELAGDGVQHGGVNAVGEVAHEGFAAELKEDAFGSVFGHGSAPQFEAGEPAHADVLARLADGLGDHVLDGDGFVADEGLEEEAELLGVAFCVVGDLLGGEVVGVGSRHLEGDVLNELAEVVGAGDEVGLAVDLDDGAEAAVVVEVGVDEALGGGAFGALGGGGVAFLAEDAFGLLEVAVGLFEGGLAVQHAGAGEFA